MHPYIETLNTMQNSNTITQLLVTELCHKAPTMTIDDIQTFVDRVTENDSKVVEAIKSHMKMCDNGQEVVEIILNAIIMRKMKKFNISSIRELAASIIAFKKIKLYVDIGNEVIGECYLTTKCISESVINNNTVAFQLCDNDESYLESDEVFLNKYSVDGWWYFVTIRQCSDEFIIEASPWVPYKKDAYDYKILKEFTNHCKLQFMLRDDNTPCIMTSLHNQGLEVNDFCGYFGFWKTNPTWSGTGEIEHHNNM